MFKKLWNAFTGLFLKLVAFVGFVFFGYLVMLGLKLHDPWIPTLSALFVFICLKLFAFAGWNQTKWPDMKRIFFSTTNFLWLGLWIIFYGISAVGR